MLGGIFADVLAGLVFIICFIIVIGLLFVLVRFLLVATKAAEIYVAKNGPARPTVESTPTAPTTSPTTPVATRTRTPKTPPTT
jgi:hypothetical protein